MSRLSDLQLHGQSFWLDKLSRSMLRDGSLTQRIERQSLRGITSNPAIFHNSINDSDLYDEAIAQGIRKGLSLQAIYRDLVVEDVTQACDLMRPLYDESNGADGYVSLEVSPHLARDAQGTLREAQYLWRRVDRPNLLIKVPGTKTCMPVVEELLYRGINVNITLLFGLDAYWDCFQAYLRAQDRRCREGKPLAPVVSVASFFLSRIDVAVDDLLKQRMADDSEANQPLAQSLLGKAAVANAKLAYASFLALLMGEKWRRLEEKGAKAQRIVWASTGTKNPAYSDVMYVEPLIGPQTVITLPEVTADAFDAHGEVAPTVELGLGEARGVMKGLQQLGIDFDAVTARLLEEGIDKFIEPYDAVIELLKSRRAAADEDRPDLQALQAMSDRLRADVIDMTTAAGSGHPTSSISCAELVSALFFHEMRWDPRQPKARDVDRFILSKGHAAPILWSALREAGAIEEELDTLRRMQSTLEGHPTPSNPWIPIATGSLGQGLAAANGIALANRLDGIESRIYCLMGDGECSEGSVWEAAQFASLQGLDSLVAIVDVNGLEQSGYAPYGWDTRVLSARFRAFGWQTLEIDGHDLSAVTAALQLARDGGPTAILARTQKGKGVSFLEGRQGWHGKALNQAQRERALAEIAAPDVSVAVEARHVAALRSPTAPAHPAYTVDFQRGDEVATRSAFGLALLKLGEYLPDLVVLDGDVKNSTMTEQFADAFPDRFFENHIAEQNMIGTALGLAANGKIPVAATFSAFLSRAYDFIRMAGHSRPPHMLICGSHAGVSIGADGPSQMGLEDLAMFRAIDGCSILYPCDAVSAVRLTELGVFTDGIVYLRTTRGKTPVIYGMNEKFTLGGSKTLAESVHDRLTLVAAGITVHTALRAHRLLRERGIETRVIDAYSVQPLDVKTLERAARETGTLLVVEDHHLRGGLGDAVSSQIGRLGRVFRMGITGEPHSATPDELFEHHHISVDSVTREAAGVVA